MEEETENLDQVVNSLEEAEAKFEKAYKEKNYSEFDSAKKILLQLQKNISEIAGN